MIALTIPVHTPRVHPKHTQVRCASETHIGEPQAPLACANADTAFGRKDLCATCLMHYGTQGVHRVYVQEGLHVTYLSTLQEKELFIARPVGRIV